MVPSKVLSQHKSKIVCNISAHDVTSGFLDEQEDRRARYYGSWTGRIVISLSTLGGGEVSTYSIEMKYNSRTMFAVELLSSAFNILAPSPEDPTLGPSVGSIDLSASSSNSIRD